MINYVLLRFRVVQVIYGSIFISRLVKILLSYNIGVHMSFSTQIEWLVFTLKFAPWSRSLLCHVLPIFCKKMQTKCQDYWFLVRFNSHLSLLSSLFWIFFFSKKTCKNFFKIFLLTKRGNLCAKLTFDKVICQLPYEKEKIENYSSRKRSKLWLNRN